MNSRGLALLLGAAFFFSLMSVQVKTLGRVSFDGGAPLPSTMIVLGRAIVTLVLSYGMLVRSKVPPLGTRRGLLLARGTLGFVGLLCFFTALTRHAEGESVKSIRDLFLDKDNANNWYADWQSMSGGPEALSSDQKLLMRKLNPVRIPRNHQVDRAIRLSEAGHRSAFDSLLSSLESPYDEDSRFIEYETPPTPEEEIRQTFCGT